MYFLVRYIARLNIVGGAFVEKEYSHCKGNFRDDHLYDLYPLKSE